LQVAALKLPSVTRSIGAAATGEAAIAANAHAKAPMATPGIRTPITPPRESAPWHNPSRMGPPDSSTGAHSRPQATSLALAAENPPQMRTRRGAGVVERGGLENR